MTGKKRKLDEVGSGAEERFKEEVRRKVFAGGGRSGPRRMARLTENGIRALRYFEGPDYEPAAEADAGGRLSTVVLGPGSYVTRRSDANSKLPQAIVAARTHYGIGFKAGHLVNAEFGGDGQNARNLTILTPSANSAMRAFDNRVKDACGQLWHAYVAMNKLGIEVANLEFGIALSIAVGTDTWSVVPPGDCIADELTCTARLHRPVNVQALLDAAAPDPGDRLQGWRSQLDAATQAVNEVIRLLAEANASSLIDNRQNGADASDDEAMTDDEDVTDDEDALGV
ncbi:hypothetical protein [Actinophytocola sp.]|jgi:hypothetical protein|uniref:hypothetical protein n=1 Tax=Actinophytocola sp. TaxID=1872138 RepID=UPI002ED8BBEC